MVQTSQEVIGGS